MNHDKYFFQVGGNLDQDAPSYIERSADSEILSAVQRGELCLVLAPRQTGKSSLMVHTRARLQQQGGQVGVIDLQLLGSQPDPAQWFSDVVFQIEDSLKLATNTSAWWQQRRQLGPMQRFITFLEEVVLGEIQGQVTLFFDEIDSVLKLPFADDFFTTLRSIYNARSTKPALKRLGFVLLGVATASEFIKDRSRTPFNIGVAIQLHDFTPEHIHGFQKVLGENSDALIERIFYWTGGQPFLVQVLAAAIYALPSAERSPAQIDREVESRFFKGDVEQDTHLAFMQNYLLGDRTLLRKLLKTYQQLLLGKTVRRDPQSLAQNRLRLAGVVRVDGETLKPRNRIYSHIFDLPWLKKHTPNDTQRLVAYGASTVLLAMLAWMFLLQPLLLPRFPAIDKIVRYSADPSVDISLSLNDTNVSKVSLHRSDNGQTEPLFTTDNLPVLFQQQQLRHTLGGLVAGRYQHTLELTGGWPQQTHRIPVELVYYPNWEVKQIPDQRLEQLNPILELSAPAIVFKDVRNGRELGKLPDVNSPITAYRWSEDRRRLLVGTKDGRLRLWEVAIVEGLMVRDRKVETKLLQTFIGHQLAVLSLVFSPDGKTVVSGSSDRSLKLWEVHSGKLIHDFIGHQGAVTVVAVTPDGRSLYSGGDDHYLQKWDMLTGQLLQSFDRQDAALTALAISTDGKRLLTGAADGSLNYWDLDKNRLSYQLQGHSTAITVAAFSQDGRLILSGDSGGMLKTWDSASGKQLTAEQAFAKPINNAGFAAQDQLVFAQADSNELKTWEVATGKIIPVYSGHQGYITSGLSFSANGKMIVTGSSDKSMRLWDNPTGQLVRVFQHTGEVWSPRFLSNDSQLISAEARGENALRLWDIASGKEHCALLGHKDDIWGLDVSADGKLAASASWDKTVKIWDIAHCKELATLVGHKDDVLAVAFSPDGKLLASGGFNDTIKLWDVETGKELRSLKGDKIETLAVAFTPDGKTLVSGGSDNTIKLWDITTGTELRTLTGHTGDVTSVAISANGKNLASASTDGTVKLWDLATGQVLRNFTGHKGAVLGVAYSPDGLWLASGGYDGVIKIWWAAVAAPD